MCDTRFVRRIVSIVTFLWVGAVSCFRRDVNCELCLFWTVSAIYQLEDSLTSMRNHIRSFLSTTRSLCNDMYVLGHGSVEKCTNRLKKRLPRRRKATLTYTLINRLQDGRAINNTAKTKQSWQWFSRVSSDYRYIYIDSAVHEATHYQFGEKESLERDSC